MLSWQWPYLGLLLPLPIVLRWLLSARETAQGALRVPFFEQLQTLDQEQQRTSIPNWLSAGLLWLMWSCLLIASAKPMWVGDPVTLPQERRDLMLAVDISGSMRERDMLVNRQYVKRIDAVKAVVGEFIEKRQSDRLGLILFGEQSYLQTPLTYDSNTVKQQLHEAQLGFAGANATAIGDSIGLAIKRLRDRPADSRVLILLTDGASNAGTDPLQAALVAAEANIRIHTVGIGASNRRTELDEKTLNIVAKRTGGKYFRARNPKELEDIYSELDKLEPTPDEQTFRPTKSLAHIPSLGALIFGFFMALLVRRRRS